MGRSTRRASHVKGEEGFCSVEEKRVPPALLPVMLFTLYAYTKKRTFQEGLSSRQEAIRWQLGLPFSVLLPCSSKTLQDTMDAFVSLEESLGTAPQTVIPFSVSAGVAPVTTSAASSTEDVFAATQAVEAGGDNDHDDAYELHQSKRLAEQFELVDEDPVSSAGGSSAADPSSYFQTAVQRVRQRIEQQQKQKQKEKEQLAPHTTPLELAQEKESSFEIATTQPILTEAQENSETPQMTIANEKEDDDDDDEIVRPTQKHKAPVHFSEDEEPLSSKETPPPQAPIVSQTSLFVGENQSDEDGDALSEDELSSKIENYHSMSREQRFLARKLERSKLRAAKNALREEENEKYLGSDRKILTKIKERKGIIEKNKSEKLKKHELLRQNELLKKSIEREPIIGPTKFSKSKLLNTLKLTSDFDSDNENENLSSNNNSEHVKTPPTSPQKEEKKILVPKILRVKSASADKVVDLGSASDSDHADDIYNDGDDEDGDGTSINKKTKMLDVKLFYSKKKKMKMEKKKKATLTDRIRKFNAQQLKAKISFPREKNSNKDDNLTDEVLAKMLLEEQMKNSNIRAKQLKEKKRIEKQKKLLQKGQFPTHDDDPEFSEYSSDYELSSDDSADYNSDIDPPSKQTNENVLGISQNDAEPMLPLTQNIQQGSDFQLTQTDALKNFNLSFTQIYGNSQTQKTDDQLTALEKFQKMRDQNNGIPLEPTQETNESSIENSRLLNETSFLTKQLQKDDFEEDQHREVSIEEHQTAHLKEMLDSQNLVLATQVDTLSMSTQKLDAPLSVLSAHSVSTVTQVEISTQLPESLLSREDREMDHNDDDDDDDDDEKIKKGRKSKVKDRSENNSSLEEEAEEEETEEMRLERVEMIKLAKKKERELRRQREKEFKSKGLGQIMENEAVESDDEYHGAGGAEGDISDEENSEDEKLIDDGSNVEIDENEMRRIQLEKDLKEDQEQVSKTYKDIKTHKLAERRAKDGVYAVDLSDDDEADENDQLYRWREFIKKRKLKERQEFMEKNKINIAEDDPKKPFFDAMAVNLPSHISIYKDSFMNSPSEVDSMEEPGLDHESKNIFANDYDIDNNPPAKKRKLKSKNYSFENDDDIRFSSFKDQELERARDDVLSDDEDGDIDGTEGLKRLKKKTSVHLNRKLRASRVPPPKAAAAGDDADELDSLSLLSSKSSSITASFKKATEKKIKISANTGNVIREVKVTTSSKTVTNSRAAVTKLTSTESFGSDNFSKRIVKGSCVDRLDKMLAKSRKLGIKRLAKGH